MKRNHTGSRASDHALSLSRSTLGAGMEQEESPQDQSNQPTLVYPLRVCTVTEIIKNSGDRPIELALKNASTANVLTLPNESVCTRCIVPGWSPTFTRVFFPHSLRATQFSPNYLEFRP